MAQNRFISEESDTIYNSKFRINGLIIYQKKGDEWIIYKTFKSHDKLYKEYARIKNRQNGD